LSYIILFDIDGTLVLTGGAGSRAMRRAFHDVFQVDNAFDGIPMPGRTDSSLLAQALARAGLTYGDDLVGRFRSCYYDHLADALEEPHPGKRVMPGVRPLLDALSQREDVFLALLTGNFGPSARLKLQHFDLWRYFPCGAFGEDAEDRNLLVPIAIERARIHGAKLVDAGRILVVGDTPLDVACAVAAGARAVAVATGPADVATLRGSGAHEVFEDLSDTEAFLKLLE
jgi:phosphoglycolate phosphatase-like HAD superfamily hydrolase